MTLYITGSWNIVGYDSDSMLMNNHFGGDTIFQPPNLAT